MKSDLTPAERRLLAWIHISGPGNRFLTGPRVRTAKGMPELVKLEDRGDVKNHNDQRWYATLTKLGEKVATDAFGITKDQLAALRCLRELTDSGFWTFKHVDCLTAAGCVVKDPDGAYRLTTLGYNVLEAE